jgi:tetratricopeptide (TPR) repeat protein
VRASEEPLTAGPPQNPEDPRRGPFSEEERSDLFSVEPYSKGASIPPLERVPLTPEELRRQRNRRVALIAATVLAVVALVVVSGLLVARARLEAALERAGDTGRVAAVDEALGLVEGSGDPTYRALAFRLRAMRLLAGEEEDVEALAAMGEDLPTTGRAGRQRGIGATYLALAQGDLEAAMRSASAVVARGPDAVEAARARALAARAVGNAEQARQAALLAVNQRPEAPRHVALLAELLAQTVGAEAGLDRLDQLPRDVTSAAVTLARARILEAAGADRAEVEAAARAVLAFDDATDHERSWAELLLAHVAADQGHRATARAHLARAEEEAPPGDERFTLGLIEAALRNGAASQAERVARRLPSPLSVDAGRRALVDAELALAAHAGRRAPRPWSTPPRVHAPPSPALAWPCSGIVARRRGRSSAKRRRTPSCASPP